MSSVLHGTNHGMRVWAGAVLTLGLATAAGGCQGTEGPDGQGGQIGSISNAAQIADTLDTFYQECLEVDQVTDPPSLLSDDANLFTGNDPADGTPSFRKPSCNVGLSLPNYRDWNDLGNALNEHRLQDLNDVNGRDPSAFPQSNSCVGAAQVLSKMDLTYIAASQNGQFAYFAVQRSDNSGDAGYYWLFTKQQPGSAQGSCKNGQYDLTYNITTGDVLLGGHYSSSGTPLLRVFKANRNENNVSAVSAVDFTNVRWTEDSTRLKNVAVNTTKTAAGLFGVAGLKSPLDGNANMDTQLFAEAAIDLATFGQQGGVACGDLFYASVITRSSGSGGTSPDLKDLAGPAKFNLQAVSAAPELIPRCDGFEYHAHIVGPQGSTCTWTFTDVNGNPIRDGNGVPITSNTCDGTVTLTPADQAVAKSYIGTVTAHSPNGCTSSNVGSSPTVPPGGCFNLGLTKTVDRATASPGDSLTYTLTYTNTGNAALTNVVVTDPLPSRTTFVSVSSAPAISCSGPPAGSAGTVTCTRATLIAGASGTITITVKLDSSFPAGSTTVTNTATAVADQAGPVSASASTVVTAAPVLSITKTAQVSHSPLDINNTASVSCNEVVGSVSSSAAVNESRLSSITYTITIANSGNADASGVVVSDPLPAGTSFVSATGGGVFANGVVTWSVSSLSALGGNAALQLVVSVN